MRRLSITAAALAVCLGFASQASANLLVNGSFETGDFTGWTVNANNTSVEPSGISGFGGYNAEDGHYYAALGNVASAGPPLGTVAQSFTTTAGDSYTLTYYLASNGTTPNEFRTDINGTTYFDQTNIPTQPYTLYTYTFTATGSSSTLTFYERDDPNYLALDNVSVNLAPLTAVVPEPSTLHPAGLAALLSLGHAWRRGRHRGRRPAA
ncbi:MAG TPA: DUF642 domain-containing protein [Isosphaeraceae bacterium]|nr:DUF642 domain-containing protein [Isosphaeraceae bacterium]